MHAWNQTDGLPRHVPFYYLGTVALFIVKTMIHHGDNLQGVYQQQNRYRYGNVVAGKWSFLWYNEVIPTKGRRSVGRTQSLVVAHVLPGILLLFPIPS